MSAIAAFLALSAPQAFAQATPADVPAMVSPVAAPEPSPPAPVTVPQAAEPPAPKPVIRLPIDLPAEPVTNTAERPAAIAKTAPVRAERSAARTRSAEPAPAATETIVPAAAAVVTREALPVAPPVTAPVEPAANLSPLPVEATPAEATTSSNAFPWELAGGAAALLLVGGAGLAFARRRRANDRADDAAMSLEEMAAAEAVPYSLPRAEVAPQPAMHSTPGFAAAPHGSMGRHEAMALAGPTPDNPFETLKKRLQRARFLDRQERAQYDVTLGAQKDMQRKPVSAWEIAHRVVPAPAEQEVRRPERGGARPGNLRPGLIRH